MTAQIVTVTTVRKMITAFVNHVIVVDVNVASENSVGWFILLIHF